MAVIRHFDIERLKPYRREADRMPKPAPEKMDTVAELDPNLRPDEQSYVNHYLKYADVLLDHDGWEQNGSGPKSSRSNVIELPVIQEPAGSEQDDSNDNGKVA